MSIMMVDVEVLYRGRQKGVTDLSYGRKLPLWFSAFNDYLKTHKQDVDAPITEFHVYFIVFAEFGCTVDELGQASGVKIDLIEEIYLHIFELRGVDEGHDIL
jgi:hypothetical protein